MPFICPSATASAIVQPTNPESAVQIKSAISTHIHAAAMCDVECEGDADVDMDEQCDMSEETFPSSSVSDHYAMVRNVCGIGVLLTSSYWTAGVVSVCRGDARANFRFVRAL
jgi:hypothetical protein